MSTALTYRSYAKINVYLDVLDRRRDGYHNIETIFQTVSLCDELSFQEERGHIVLTCSSSELDTQEGNLVYRAAVLLQDRSGCRDGARIHLEKNVPIAAGLAGGSGNAAAALIGLNSLWDLRWPIERLRALAAELGADVPYCTLGGTVAATRRGDELSALAPLEGVWFVLVHPEIAVSTARVYNHPRLERSGEKPFAGRTRAFRNAITRLEAGDVAGAVFNRMESAVFHDHPNLGAVKARLLEAGCAAAAMSGSGPTVFGVCADQRQATRVASALDDLRTTVVRTARVGVERTR